jgi:hypothetical protein
MLWHYGFAPQLDKMFSPVGLCVLYLTTVVLPSVKSQAACHKDPSFGPYSF